MKAATLFANWQRLAVHPLVVLACLAAGGVIGWAWPGVGRGLSVVGEVYVALLKMIVLPFMLSAVIFSLQKMAHQGGTGRLMARAALVFTSFSIGAAIVAATSAGLMAPGDHLSADTRALLGGLIGADAGASDVEFALYGTDEAATGLTAREVLLSLIPSNIFASLAQAETLKALVFALLFGLAVAHVPGTGTLATVYRGCNTLMRWINLPLPLVLVCMLAGQVAASGLGPVQAMGGFVLSFVAVAALLTLGAGALLAWRAGVRQASVWRALRETMALAVATNNSLACMPAMVNAMVEGLNFARAQVELLVPLAVTLLRTGAVAYFVCATLFIAALYGRTLAPDELAMVVGLSVLAGFASTGMAGVLTLTLVGTVCSALALPFEAVLVLLVAVDPVCGIFRTLVTVVGACAAVAVAGPAAPLAK